MSRLSLMKVLVAAISAAAALATAGALAAQAQSSWPGHTDSQPTITIQPMTHVDAASATGYFSDPYPISAAPRWTTAPIPPSFSGTTKDILSCPDSIHPECFKAMPIIVSSGPILIQQAQSEGSTIAAFEINNIFRDNTGEWQMATTAYIKNPSYPNAGPWNVIVHAHPSAASFYSIPTGWIADTLPVGSFAQPARANYDGKYFADSGNLYLVYSKRLSNQLARDGIVA